MHRVAFMLSIGLLAGFLAACAGEVVESANTPDETQQKPAAPVPAAAAACSETGVAAACDPVGQTGCPEGAACYVLKNTGPSCTCPGTIAAGEACQTTAECAPGHVCAGTAAPGVCRKTCDPNAEAPDCPDGTYCLFINGYADNGFCQVEGK